MACISDGLQKPHFPKVRPSVRPDIVSSIDQAGNRVIKRKGAFTTTIPLVLARLALSPRSLYNQETLLQFAALRISSGIALFRSLKAPWVHACGTPCERIAVYQSPLHILPFSVRPGSIQYLFVIASDIPGDSLDLSGMIGTQGKGGDLALLMHRW